MKHSRNNLSLLAYISEPLEQNKTVTLLNKAIQSLNKKISYYQEKPSVYSLQKVIQKMQEMSDRFPENVLAAFPNYLNEMYHKLVSEIIQEKKNYEYFLDNKMIQLSYAPQQIFRDVLERMSPSVFSKLLSIFYSKKHDRLQEKLEYLYKGQHTPIQNERLFFTYFIKTHDIHLLSYSGNTNIFQITNQITFESCILRCRKPRENTNRLIEKKLIKCLGISSIYIAPIYYERKGITRSGLVRDIQIYPFFIHQSLHDQLNHEIKENRPLKILRLICVSCAQIIKFMICCQQHGFILTDIKLSNFLIDIGCLNEIKIKIIDLKSSRRIHNNQTFCYREDEIIWNSKLLFTRGFFPNEVYHGEGKHCDVEKTNVFMLGICLYNMLTNTKNYLTKEPYHIRRLTEKDFKRHEIFQSGSGVLLKRLILNATHDDPKERLSYDDFLQGLDAIYPYALENECRIKIKYLLQSNPYHPEYLQLEKEFNCLIDNIDLLIDHFYGLQQKIMQSLQSHLRQKYDIYVNDIPLISEISSNTLEFFLSSLQQCDQKKQDDIHHILFQKSQTHLEDIQVLHHELHEELAHKDYYFHEFILKNNALLQSSQVSLQQMVQLDEQLQSIKELLVSSKMKEVLHIIRNNDESRVDRLTILHLIPYHHRLQLYYSHSVEQLLNRLETMKSCYFLLDDINEYRFENLSEEPIIVDVTTRRYIQSQMEKLHDSKTSQEELCRLRHKLRLDLTRLTNSKLKNMPFDHEPRG